MIRLSLAALLVLVMVLSRGQTTSAHTGTWQVQAGNGLNLRTGPAGPEQLMDTVISTVIVLAAIAVWAVVIRDWIKGWRRR